MKRIVFLDYVRVFACFLVMVVHASENFYGAAGSIVGGRVRWFFMHGSTIVYDCLCLSAGTDEGGTDFMAVLPPTLHSYPATVFYIYDTL